MASEASSPHHIVVVGGGAGGLELATRLGDILGRCKLSDVTLIDRSRSHLWKPLLHEIAAGTMDLGVHEIDFLSDANQYAAHLRHRRHRRPADVGAQGGARSPRCGGNRGSEEQCFVRLPDPVGSVYRPGIY